MDTSSDIEKAKDLFHSRTFRLCSKQGIIPIPANGTAKDAPPYIDISITSYLDKTDVDIETPRVVFLFTDGTQHLISEISKKAAIALGLQVDKWIAYLHICDNQPGIDKSVGFGARIFRSCSYEEAFIVGLAEYLCAIKAYAAGWPLGQGEASYLPQITDFHQLVQVAPASAPVASASTGAVSFDSGFADDVFILYNYILRCDLAIEYIYSNHIGIYSHLLAGGLGWARLWRLAIRPVDPEPEGEEVVVTPAIEADNFYNSSHQAVSAATSGVWSTKKMLGFMLRS